MIELIRFDDKILAIHIKTAKIDDKLSFISPENFPLQVGIHNKEKDDYIEAHEHIPFPILENMPSQEIFYLESGALDVGIYLGDKKVANKVLYPGDLIILNCGHDLKFLEKTKMIEIKQGPYRGKENEKKYIGKKNDSCM